MDRSKNTCLWNLIDDNTYGKEDIARLSPYLTSHIKRFEDYVLGLDTVPNDIEKIKNISLF